MYLSPREQEKLLIVVAADVARRRRDRGLKLNHPEAVALITAEVLEGIRDGQITQAAQDAVDNDVHIVGMSSLVTFLENTSDYRRAYREREYGSLDHDRALLEEAPAEEDEE